MARILSLFLIFYVPNIGFSKVINFNLLDKKKDTIVLKKVALVGGIEVAGYVSSMFVLNNLWYKNYPRSSFHWFNDNRDWLQMDKVGHATTSYYMGKVGIDALKWAGVNNRKSVMYGGVLGLAFLTSVEVFDGFSVGWGASVGDVVANFSGATLLIVQEVLWREQRVSLKYSAHFTPYAKYRPNILGSSWSEQLLKDYNGQTYWGSINLKSFAKESSRMPGWLNLALGYSADGMTGGSENILLNSSGEWIPIFERQRQFFLSLDVDLTKIKTKSPLLRAIFNTVGFLKFPFPTLEFGTKTGLKGHVLYF